MTSSGSSNNGQSPLSHEQWLRGGGKMGERVRSMDWSKTPLGPLKQWPKSLRTLVSMVLESPFPKILCWGPDLTVIYNNAYRPLLGKKHEALGRPFLAVWSEAADIIKPLVEKALAGEACYFANAPFTLMRNGYPEQTWFEFSFSPVRDDDGNVAGILNTVVETTEKNLAQLKLREKESIYRRQSDFLDRILRQSPIATAVLQGEELRFTMANPTYEFIVKDGRSVIGRTYRDVFRQAAEQGAEALLLHVLRTGEPKKIEDFKTEIPGLEDSTWWEGKVLRIPNAAGELDSVLVLTWEITERKRAEQALHESERKWRELAEAMPQLVWTATPHGESDFFSRQWIEYTGVPEEDQRGFQWLEQIHPDDREDLWNAWEGALRSGAPFEADHRIRRRDGAYRWFKSRAVPVADEAGRIVKWYGSSTDIHDLHITEQALRRSEAFANKVLSSSLNGIYVYDLNTGTHIFVNPQYIELTGYTLEDFGAMSGSQFFRLFHREDKGTIAAHMEAIANAADGEIHEMEYRFKTASGRWIWCLSRDSVFARNPDGSVRQMIGSFLDITQRKEMEEELRRAKEAAEAANRSKSEFLANMSHEIRTPLSAVMGVTDMALAMDPGEKQEKYLKMIKESSKSLLQIINDILDLSKIEAGRMDLNHEELNLTELLQSVVDMFRIQARQKGLCLCWEIDPQIPLSLVGDPVRLRQILVNLLGNALKFTQQGEVKVNIGKAEEDATDEVVTLLCSVTDTGIGIPEDKKGLLFESFTQADSSTSKRYAGTGLGLAICKRLAGMMGGEIWFESTEGKGTSFHFTVRFPKSSMEKTKKSSEMGASRPQDLRGLKILLAEDNKIIQMALRQVVEQLGASCVTVSNGKEVMSSLEAGGFDVVLMDVQMPEMDGVEATRAIRKSESERIDPSIPIIGLTAYAMEGDRERFLRAGMNDCVFKPMEDEELHDAIKRLVTARPNSNPIYREPHPAPPRKPRP